jgi:hypothetical protein
MAAVALVVAVILAVPSSILLWQSLAHPPCDFGAIRSPDAAVFPAVTIGAIAGIGLGVACAVAASVWRAGHPWRAVLAGAAVQWRGRDPRIRLRGRVSRRPWVPAATALIARSHASS